MHSFIDNCRHSTSLLLTLLVFTSTMVLLGFDRTKKIIKMKFLMNVEISTLSILRDTQINEYSLIYGEVLVLIGLCRLEASPQQHILCQFPPMFNRWWKKNFISTVSSGKLINYQDDKLCLKNSKTFICGYFGQSNFILFFAHFGMPSIEIFHFKIYVDIGWKLANIHSDDFDSCYLAKHTVVDEL